MMDELLRRAAELRGQLQQVLLGPILSGAVQGAILEVDPFWLEAFFWDRFGDPHWRSWLSGAGLFVPPIKWDYSFRPFNWSAHCKARGYHDGSGPFLIRVILYSHAIHRSEFPNDYPTVHLEYPLVYERRPPLEALSSIPGRLVRSLAGLAFGNPEDDDRRSEGIAVSIGRADPTPTAGSLGGLLQDQLHGKQYLVSCAHVLGDVGTMVYTPGPYENRGMNEIGIVRFSAIPPVNPSNQFCNERASPAAGRLDLAVAELLPHQAANPKLTSLPRIHTVRLAASTTGEQPVAFIGKVSGRVSAYLGGCTIWHAIKFPDGTRCFGHLFELVAPKGRRGPLARKGDSGAWVLDRNTELNCWVGMLIAAVPENGHAYCCFAQDILDACRTALPPGLTLVP